MQPFRRPARVRAQRLLVAVLACVTGLVSPGVDGRAQAATYLPFTRFTPDTDGGMLAITHITDGNALNDTGVLRRYRPDGSLDAAFGFSGDAPGPRDIANWVPEHVRRLADGRLAVSARRRNYLAIYDSSGQPTGSTIHFHPTQIQVIRDLEPLPDGRFIVAGVDTTSQTMLALIAEPVPNTNGTSTRHNLPISAGDFRTADIAIDASGRMFVTSCSLYRANDGCEVAVLSPSGAIDLGYGTAGRLTLNGARCSTGVRPDGSLIAACTALSSAVLAITAFDPAGRAIPTFPPNLIDIGTEQDVGLAVEGSGRFFVGYTTKSTHETAIRAFNVDGAINTSFGAGGTFTTSEVDLADLRVAASGGLLATGHVWPAAQEDRSSPWIQRFATVEGSALQPPLATQARYVPLAPTRLLDTREAIGISTTSRIRAGGVVVLDILGRGSVPAAGVSAAVLNITATDPLAPGFVTVWPSGSAMPIASNLNLNAPGQTVANLVVVPVGPDGRINIFAQTTTHLVADISGYFLIADQARDGRYQPAAVPHRALDTRLGLGVEGQTAKPAAGATIRLQVAGVGPVPGTGASAVVLNVTGSEAAGGFVTVWPGGDRPTTSVLNLDRDDTRANLVIVPIGPDGTVSLFTQLGTHLIADIAGWFTDASAPLDEQGLFVAIPPRRMLDTRITPGKLPFAGAIGRLIGATTVVPPYWASSVVANITITEPSGPGYVTAVASGVSRPAVSNLNVGQAGETVPNLAIVGLRSESIDLFAQPGGHLIVDVTGWFR